MNNKTQKTNNNQNNNDELLSLKKELFRLNTQKATGSSLENPGNVRKIKRGIARILTKINNNKEVRAETK